jgi:4-hydroxyacetophenone monooxygenase
LTDLILSELKDRPDLIEKCVPTYPVYGKRILLDNNARSEFQPRAWPAA